MPSILLGVRGEVLVDELLLQADRLEDLRAAIRLVGRDAHLRHHLVQSLADRLDEMLRRFLWRNLRHVLSDRGQRFQREVRMNRLRSVRGEQREMMHLARRTRFDDEPGAGAQALAHQMLMHGGSSEQRRDRHQFRRHLAVGTIRML
jgi:hypothetical protein